MARSAIIGDMQKMNFTENRKQFLLFHLFSLLDRFSCLVMYYAAGLTLNSLFAGISSPVVSVPAMAVAAGAVLGRYLFGKFRERMLEEIRELPDEYTLAALKQELALSDLVSVILTVILAGRAGIVLSLGVIAAWLIRLLLKPAEEYEMIPLLLSVSAGGLLAVTAMRTGRAGLYGVIMFCLIAMDILRMHRRTRFEEKAQTETDPVSLVFSGAAKILTSAVFFLVISETNRVLSYRISMTRTVSGILLFVCAAAAGCAYALADRRSYCVKAERISSLITAVITVLGCLGLNRYCALLTASGSLAVLVMPALLGRLESNEDQESIWHGVITFLFLSVAAAGSWLLYWGAKASFDEILMNVILFMTVCMHTGIGEYSEVYEDGELESAEDAADHLADSDQPDQSLDVRD